jgi:RHS repeat-associated protein
LTVQAKYLLKKELTTELTEKTVYSSYPFGMPMPNRTYSLSSTKYRFGFNGKERDDETYGEGNEYDFGARIYNPRLGRWLSLDPLMAKYPSLSPYNFTANNPILFIDPDGKIIRINMSDAKTTSKAFTDLQKLTSEKLVLLKDGQVTTMATYNKGLEAGMELQPIQEYGNNPTRALPTGTKLVQTLLVNEKTVEIINSSDGNNRAKANLQVEYNPDKGIAESQSIKNSDYTGGRPAEIGLAHELVHTSNSLNGGWDNKENPNLIDPDNPSNNSKGKYLDNEEVKTRKVDSKIRKEQGVKERAQPYQKPKPIKAVTIKGKKGG